MELAQILGNLWRRKVALTAVALVAFVAAISAVYEISPAGLKKRGTSFGAAQTQILVDSPKSALANLKQDTLPLTTRAGVFAQLMASSAVRAEVAAVTGIPAKQIVSRGPFDDPAAAPEDASPTPKAPETTALGRKRYRLTLVAQEELPLVTVYAEAPTAALAKRLADSVSVAVERHVERLQAAGELAAKYRVVIRQLGSAETGTVVEGPGAASAALVFIGVMLVGCFLILAITRLTGGLYTQPVTRAPEEEPPALYPLDTSFFDEPAPSTLSVAPEPVDTAPDLGAPDLGLDTAYLDGDWAWDGGGASLEPAPGPEAASAGEGFNGASAKRSKSGSGKRARAGR